MDLQVGVKVFLRNKQGKYLLLHRSSHKYPEINNPWDIPGGRINPGTPLLDNLRREIKEETGLELAEKPKLLAAQDILRIPDKHVIRITYVATISGLPTLDLKEHDDFKWVSKAEFLEQDNLDLYVKELLDRGILNG